MPIRILHVVNNLGKGGLENGLVNLILHMDARRFEHIVCTVRGLGANCERLPLERVRVCTLASDGSASRFQTPALARIMRRLQPDIVHSRNWAAIEGVMAGRLARVPAVVHSEHGFEADSSEKEPARRVYFRRLAYQLADRVFSVSSHLRDLHASRTGFPATRIGVIHNGVDRGRFRPDPGGRARIRRELGIAAAEFCIGCVANLLPVKDHMTLLKATEALATHRSDWRLLLIGDGPERGALQAFVAGHEWKDRVTFLGSTSRVPELLQALDVFVLPSIAEGICNSLLEAMATALPVVATSVGGNPEVVVNGDSGLLFASGDVTALAGHLRRLVEDQDLRSSLGQHARERVRDRFSIESMVRAYERLYLDLQPAEPVPALTTGRH